MACVAWFQVVLVGMGADEQLAGYSRHRTRFMLVIHLGNDN